MRESSNTGDGKGADWYLLFSKPRQEWRARDNLVRQGYTVFLPTLVAEKVQSGARVEAQEVLFPRYMFISLDNVNSNWLPIRSTLGVASLVRFGDAYCRVPAGLVPSLMQAEQQKRNLLNPGDSVAVTSGPFNGLEGIYQQPDGIRRVLVLMNLFSRPQTISLPVATIKRVVA